MEENITLNNVSPTESVQQPAPVQPQPVQLNPGPHQYVGVNKFGHQVLKAKKGFAIASFVMSGIAVISYLIAILSVLGSVAGSVNSGAGNAIANGVVAVAFASILIIVMYIAIGLSLLFSIVQLIKCKARGAITWTSLIISVLLLAYAIFSSTVNIA